MSDKEFNALLDALTGGLPITLVMTRLALLVRSLVESGGEPAADLLRALVIFHDDPPGDYSEQPPAALVERMNEP